MVLERSESPPEVLHSFISLLRLISTQFFGFVSLQNLHREWILILKSKFQAPESNTIFTIPRPPLMELTQSATE